MIASHAALAADMVVVYGDPMHQRGAPDA